MVEGDNAHSLGMYGVKGFKTVIMKYKINNVKHISNIYISKALIFPKYLIEAKKASSNSQN